jgi:hypothetical protein
MESVTKLLAEQRELAPEARDDSLSDNDSDNETNSELDETNSDEQSDLDLDEMDVESLMDVESEDENNAYQDFERDGDAAMADSGTETSSLDTPMVDDNTEDVESFADEADMPGARLRTCLNRLQQLHQDKIHANLLPSWPFADHLEFEFVKWMVENDVSQTAVTN